MKMELTRTAKKSEYTIGRLTVDGEYLCDTLEPTWRDLRREGKVSGRTAIPEGTYKVFVTKSVKFRRWLPLVWQVPGFEGIRIHAGNTVADTRGCILVGWNRQQGRLINSRSALMLLMNRMTAALSRNELLELEIR